MSTFRSKLLNLYQTRSLSGSALVNALSISRFGLSQTGFLVGVPAVGVIVCKLHSSSLACNVSNCKEIEEVGVEHLMANVSKRNLDALKSTFPALHQLTGSHDIDFVRKLEKIVKPISLKDVIDVCVPDNCNHSTDVSHQTQVKCEQLARCVFLPENSSTNSLCYPSFSYVATSSSQWKTVKSEHGHLCSTLYKHAQTLNRSSNDNTTETDNSKPKGPTLPQLDLVKRFYEERIPQMMKNGDVYDSSSVLHKDLIFENILFKKPKITKGISNYKFQIQKYQLLSAVCFVRTNTEVLSSFVDPDEGSVRIHWRYNYLPYYAFWSALGKHPNLPADQVEQFVTRSFEGICTFYVDSDGKVIKHRVDSRAIDHRAEFNVVEKLAKLAANPVPASRAIPVNKTATRYDKMKPML